MMLLNKPETYLNKNTTHAGAVHKMLYIFQVLAHHFSKSYLKVAARIQKVAFFVEKVYLFCYYVSIKFMVIDSKS